VSLWQRNGGPGGPFLYNGCQKLLADMSTNFAVLKPLSEGGHPNAAVWPVLGSLQLQIIHELASMQGGREPVPTLAGHIVTTLHDCASLPGVTLDDRFQEAIVSAIGLHVARDECDAAFSLLRLLDESLIDRKEPGLALQPIDVTCLLRLMSEFTRAPLGGKDPEATMTALLSALLAHSPTLALDVLDRACDAGLTQHAPYLACIGYLHLANAFLSRGDERNLLSAFCRALAPLPDKKQQRDELMRRFQRFLAGVQCEVDPDLAHVFITKYLDQFA